MIKFHVIIPIYNTPKEDLVKCISSVVKATALSDVDTTIYMIDDASDPEYSAEIATWSKDNLKYHRLDVNSGGLFCTRLNAIKIVNPDPEDWLFWVDSDDRVSADYFTEAVNTIIDYPEVDMLDSRLHEMIHEIDGEYLGSKIWYQNTDRLKLMSNRDMVASRGYKAKLFKYAEDYRHLNCFMGEDKLHNLILLPYVNCIRPFKGTYYYIVKPKIQDNWQFDDEVYKSGKLKLIGLIEEFFKSNRGHFFYEYYLNNWKPVHDKLKS